MTRLQVLGVLAILMPVLLLAAIIYNVGGITSSLTRWFANEYGHSLKHN